MTDKVDLFDWILSKMDTNVLVRIKYFADELKMPSYLVVQNIIIDHWARQAARILVEGASPHRMLPEFPKEVSDGKENVVTGEALFNSLVETYKRELIDQKKQVTELEKAYNSVLAKYLRTVEGKAELEKDRSKAIAEYEKRKQDKP